MTCVVPWRAAASAPATAWVPEKGEGGGVLRGNRKSDVLTWKRAPQRWTLGQNAAPEAAVEGVVLGTLHPSTALVSVLR